MITRDEAHNLPRLLDSVEGLADEVVVFDSGSGRTVDIAKARGARVIDCEWAGWSATKNQANAAAKGDWILSLDADEALTATSAEAIRQMVSGPLRTSDGAWRVGQIDRLTRYIDQWVHHSGWRPDRKLRLWPAGAAHWEGAIHERPVFDGPVSVERIAGTWSTTAIRAPPTTSSRLSVRQGGPRIDLTAACIRRSFSSAQGGGPMAKTFFKRGSSTVHRLGHRGAAPGPPGGSTPASG